MRDPGTLLLSVALVVVSSLSVFVYFNEAYKPALAWAVLFGLSSILWTVFICTWEIIEAIKSLGKNPEKDITPAKEQTAD